MYNKKGEERNQVRGKAASPMTRRGAGRTGRRREREGKKRMKRRREEEEKRRRGEEERRRRGRKEGRSTGRRGKGKAEREPGRIMQSMQLASLYTARDGFIQSGPRLWRACWI